MNPTDSKTLRAIKKLGETIITAATKKREPTIEIPQRNLSNVSFDRRKRSLVLGTSTSARQLFNLNQAKSYMQTMLVASGCKQLIDQEKTTSIRGLYYLLKHTIENAREETFDTQAECDAVIEDLEVTLQSMREELHVYASSRGNLAGPITILDDDDTLDCAKLGNSGYSIPSIVEPTQIKFLKCTAKFVLHVEKDTVWRRFHEDRFWQKHNCLLTHGGGQPPRGVRRMLQRLNKELLLPVYCLLDNDPWGYYIYSVIKQGSINLAHESGRMAVPDARYLGLRSRDYERCGLSSSVQIKLNDTDIKRAKQISRYPWFAYKPKWQTEIGEMLDNNFKLEVESLISKNISYVTETYVPERLAEGDWLD